MNNTPQHTVIKLLKNQGEKSKQRKKTSYFKKQKAVIRLKDDFSVEMVKMRRQ